MTVHKSFSLILVSKLFTSIISNPQILIKRLFTNGSDNLRRVFNYLGKLDFSPSNLFYDCLTKKIIPSLLISDCFFSTSF